MALIRNENKPVVILGIQNLTRGVYSSHSDGSIMVVSGPTRFDDNVRVWFGAIAVNSEGDMAVPATSSWEDVYFTRIADSVDITVPGRA